MRQSFRQKPRNMSDYVAFGIGFGSVKYDGRGEIRAGVVTTIIPYTFNM